MLKPDGGPHVQGFSSLEIPLSMTSTIQRPNGDEECCVKKVLGSFWPEGVPLSIFHIALVVRSNDRCFLSNDTLFPLITAFPF